MITLQMRIEGPINENTQLLQKPLLRGEKLDLDLEKLTFINSVGVKTWVSWIVRHAPDSEIHIWKSPYVIINQGNTVAGFFSRGTFIESFFCFYLCPSCQHEASILLKRGEHYEYKNSTNGRKVRIPENLPCPKCQAGLEPDFLPERTFKFLGE